MPLVKSILGYVWAIGCLLLVPGLFFGFGYWPQALVHTTGLQVSPRFSGGETARTIAHNGYRTLIRTPVFQGIFTERANGFVQIDWTPEEKQLLPKNLIESVDLDGDGTTDLEIKVDTVSSKAELTPLKPWVKNIETAVRADNDMIVRIGLVNYH